MRSITDDLCTKLNPVRITPARANRLLAGDPSGSVLKEGFRGIVPREAGAKEAPVPKFEGMQPQDYAVLYDRFKASVSRYDCGKYCAPLNNGEPVCCTTSLPLN